MKIECAYLKADSKRIKVIDLRQLPGIDRILREPALADLIAEHGAARVKGTVRDLQSGFRDAGQAPGWAGDPAGYVAPVSQKLAHAVLKPVFNLTGTLIHTNLGRAPVAEAAWRAAERIATRPSNLEYDLSTGRRGHRDNVVAERLAATTSAEAACVVNNNAAALLLVLNTFALSKPVPVSRGELVEIGGSFRLPEIMARAGCTLVEVGTTNRTHAKDYDNASHDAGLLLKVHPSNFHIDGFTASVDVPEMRRIADNHDIPFCVDLGSGTLTDFRQFGLPHEPTPRETLAAGAQLVTFSGDKLLGGVQAGLIVGDAQLIQALNANPLKRALRVDKITLAALAATIDLYAHPDKLPHTLPILRAMTATQEQLQARAETIRDALSHLAETSVERSAAQIGSGALPDQSLDSVSVVLRADRESALEVLHERLRGLSVPVIGRIHQSALWLDMRGAEPFEELIDVLGELK